MSDARYARLEQITWWDRGTVSKSVALVAGCGALGNEVAKNLALVGWGKLILVDFDKIELSNLTRSVFFSEQDCGCAKAVVLAREASRLNSDCQCVPLEGDLRSCVGTGLVVRSDVVFGCVDSVSARAALSRLAGQAGRPFLDGGLGIWEGTVSVYLGGDGPCYACGLTADDYRELALRRSCPRYAARAAAANGAPTTPTVASVVAANMVGLALKWVHSFRTPPRFPAGRQLRFDTAFDRSWNTELPRNPDCPLHG